MFWIRFESFASLAERFALLKKTLCYKNYLHNSSIKIFGYIHKGQGIEPVCRCRLSGSSFAHTGCEVIAGYNFLKAAGREAPLAELSAEFELNAMNMFGGVWGCNPLRIGAMLKAHGVPYKRAFSVSRLAEDFEAGKPVIAAFHIGKTRFSGIHTVFVRKENGRGYVYNRYNESSAKHPVSSLGEIMKSRHTFIVGYTLK